MGIHTFFNYLVGDREAILQIARARGAVALGAVFVLSAAIAREYDQADLLAQPWHLLIPFGASLVTSFLLYAILYLVAWRQGAAPPRFSSGYASFLALYWMTAPLAWLYAIPVERILSAGGATRANLCLLAIVALWRVVLMTRVVQALFGATFIRAFMVVMLFADGVVLTILYFTPIPILNVMGGVRLTTSEQTILHTALLVGFLGVITSWIWFFGTVDLLILRRGSWKYALADDAPRLPPNRSLWGFAAAAVVVLCCLLPITQPAQHLAHHVDQDLTHGQIARAIQRMSDHESTDFPTHWQPPPHMGYANPQPPLIDVLRVIADQGATPWVRDVYHGKLSATIERFYEGHAWNGLQPADFELLQQTITDAQPGIFSEQQKQAFQRAHAPAGDETK